MFWDDTPPPKILKTKPKRTPPPRTWEEPTYLPYLEEARAFSVPQFTPESLYAAQQRGDLLLFDVEVYVNYFLVSFASYTTGEIVCFEMDEEKTREFDYALLGWVFTNFTLVGFNSNDFDVPMVTLALAGCSCAQLKAATNQIIYEDLRGSDVLKLRKVKAIKVDSIDLIEVAPLRANLKIYGGRLHAPRMQDLPFNPEITLSEEQKLIVRWYNVNDLVVTGIMHTELKEQLDLRIAMTREYGVDLRSKSDAQIAEAVIAAQVGKLNGARPQRPEILPGTTFRYNPPAFLQYQSTLMNWVLDKVRSANFVIAANGTVGMPEHLNELKIELAGSVYRMGIGGLHSSEQSVYYRATDDLLIVDRDVTSYYPYIILNCGLFPSHMGRAFLSVYRGLVERRLAAKAKGDKAVTESLKITINGSFGKLGSPWSVLYSPHLLIQVTVTGQLALLMLIERLELAGIHVVSGNTDGIVFLCPKAREADYQAIVRQWEQDTKFETEETRYAAYYARDVNNYIAVKPDGKTKNKGVFANPWADTKDRKAAIMRFHKNPQNQICVEAVEAFLIRGVPLLDTIQQCRDVTKFVSVRTVKGGAVKDGEYLGKSIRWYYAQGETGEIIYASSGNKVPRSDGARPLMDLPRELPVDIDFARYEAEAYDMLVDLGVMEPRRKDAQEDKQGDD